MHHDRAMRAWAVGTWAAVLVAASACVPEGSGAVSPGRGRASTWTYEVVPDDAARELGVEAWLPPGSLTDLAVEPGAERFVVGLEVQEDDGGWRGVPRRLPGEGRDTATLHVPECANGCHLRYRFALGRAAAALHDVDGAIAWGDVVEASPSLWLLHPGLAPEHARYRFHVKAAPGRFVTGVFAADDGPPGTYEADATDIEVAPYAAFGPLRVAHPAAVAGAALDVAIAPGPYAASDDELLAWVSRSARTMARFFGCFPVERLMVLVVPAEGDAVRHGETMGDGGASIVVEVGDRAGKAALDRDWVLPHEMAHLAVPSVSRRHHWIEEGIAVYVQPIARARAGQLSAEAVWRELAIGMPKGVARPGGGGLDDATDWARVYWGGATFCLLADLEIRKRTGNRLSFEDALRGVLASGGSVADVWDFDRLLETADGAVGTSVLGPMHEQMGHQPWRVDLPRLFRDLGVIVHGSSVSLVDDAPLAPLRRAITEPLPPDEPAPVACAAYPPGRVARR